MGGDDVSALPASSGAWGYVQQGAQAVQNGAQAVAGLFSKPAEIPTTEKALLKDYVIIPLKYTADIFFKLVVVIVLIAKWAFLLIYNYCQRGNRLDDPDLTTNLKAAWKKLEYSSDNWALNMEHICQGKKLTDHGKATLEKRYIPY